MSRRSPARVPVLAAVAVVGTVALVALVVLALGWSGGTRTGGAGAPVDDAVLRAVDERRGEWLTHGRDYAETRYSPLDQVNASTVGRLGLAWSFETAHGRGHEATPLVVDGVIYTTSSWSVVYALDARTGELIWRWDPEVAPARGELACCDVVNRGVAFYQGRVYVGVLDGRLAALDARTGQPVWEVMTVDQDWPYTITGAPRVVDGRVIIGNAGAEYGVRGYVSAYDAATGDLVWRFYTVPGDPTQPFESPALEYAATTWTGEWWLMGGGGTVWDSLAYDPDLDLVYVGTGNGAPWNQAWRSPGGGDNLFLSSILALRAGTGELVWYYQTTPGESWDFTATQHMILADLEIGGRTRQVLMQAPKNGFFYVLDRATGELLSAEPYAEVTWATGIDAETGRPIEVPGARYEIEPVILKPGPAGAHNWHPMSYSPDTGLVYIPTIDMAFRYEHDEAFEPRDGVWNIGIVGGLSGMQPGATGALLAWDPVAQQARWEVPHPTSRNGGTLATAGNLVFQGTGEGRLVAYRADTGETLWQSAPATPINAAPITYEIDGVQYVAVMAGPRGGIRPDVTPEGPDTTRGRLLVFALDHGDAPPAAGAMPPVPSDAPAATPPEAPAATPSAAAAPGAPAAAAVPDPAGPPAPEPIPFDAVQRDILIGTNLYGANCSQCHGPAAVAFGAFPDLRYSPPEVYDRFTEIVIAGAGAGEGMPAFAGLLDEVQVDTIRAYLLSRRAELTGPP